MIKLVFSIYVTQKYLGTKVHYSIHSILHYYYLLYIGTKLSTSDICYITKTFLLIVIGYTSYIIHIMLNT